MHIILPLTKSPHSTGRWGTVEKQDWYRGLVKAKSLLQEFRPAKILVLSAFHAMGEKSEIELYLWALARLGVNRDDIIVINKARETIEQIDIATRFARQRNANLIVISTFLHYLRVRWLCRGVKAQHYVAWGIPRPREAVTDIVLTLLFPIVDLLGRRQWFLDKVKVRRESGTH